ncbi:MAG TPA: hypothetical protein VGC45_15210 [Gryllotalpicola sp.]
MTNVRGDRVDQGPDVGGRCLAGAMLESDDEITVLQAVLDASM